MSLYLEFVGGGVVGVGVVAAAVAVVVVVVVVVDLLSFTNYFFSLFS